MNEKILQPGTTLHVSSDRLFFLLSGKAQLGKKMLCEGDFLFFKGKEKFISSAKYLARDNTIDILETLSLFEVEMRVDRRHEIAPNVNENYMSDTVNLFKH